MIKSPSKYVWMTLAIVSMVAYSLIVFAAAPSGGYLVTDHELDPDCAPGTTDCFVVFPTGGSSFDLIVEHAVPGFTSPFVTGDNAVAIGDLAEAAGNWSFAAGILARAQGDESIALGSEAIAGGFRSFAAGRNAQADGINSVAIGRGARAYGEKEIVLGGYNTSYTPIGNANDADRLFVIGNGTAAGGSSSHNAFTMFQSGSFVFNDDDFEYTSSFLGADESKIYFDIDNQILRMGSTYESGRWDGVGNVGPQSIALGFSYAGNSYRAPLASGRGAVAIGANIAAIGDYSVMLGRDGSTNGTSSFAFNGVTGGEQAVAFMANADAEGNYAFAVGSHAEAYSAFEVALGRYNTLYSGFHGLGNSPNATDWEADDRLLVVGDGSSLATSDAFTILKSGEVCIAIDQCQDNSNGEVLQIGDGADNIIGYVNSTTGAYVATSDRRFKENIQDLPYGLGAVMALKPVQYDFIRNHEHSIGFIAQDVQGIVPEVVFGSEEKGYGIAYQSLTPVLVKAIQELNIKIQNIEMVSGSVNVDWTSTMRSWFADRANDIAELFAKKVTTRELCVVDDEGETCLTRSQLNALLGSNGGTPNPPVQPEGQIQDPQPEPQLQEEVIEDQPSAPEENMEAVPVPETPQEEIPAPQENPA